jgi:hypothetical protein
MTMNKKGLIIALVAAIVLGGIAAISLYQDVTSIEKVPDIVTIPVSTTTVATTSSATLDEPARFLPYGKTTLRSGDTARFKDSSLTLLRVSEDSRCAEGVTCIWAGTLKATIHTATDAGTNTEVIELGKSITTEGEMITLLAATPYPKAGTNILPNEYRLTFEVTKRPAEVKPASPVSNTKPAACFKGGCSGQICSDQDGMMSDCMFREEYACYQTAVCERQTSGECGWTSTPKLEACLSAAQ